MPTLLDSHEAYGRAFQIAQQAHASHTDRAGKPYLLHVLRVSERCTSLLDKTCALLHDVVEDTDWTLEALAQEGFPARVLAVVDLLTHEDGVSYEAYMQRIAGNATATRVKLADLQDNMDLRRLQALTERDLPRLNRYIAAYHLLANAQAGHEHA